MHVLTRNILDVVLASQIHHRPGAGQPAIVHAQPADSGQGAAPILQSHLTKSSSFREDTLGKDALVCAAIPNSASGSRLMGGRRLNVWRAKSSPSPPVQPGSRLRQVNAAVDDVAALAEANARLVAAARGRGHSLTVDDRRHAQTLIRNVAVRLFGIDLN